MPDATHTSPAPDGNISLFRAILGVSRAPFLLLPLTLIAAGAAASAYEGEFSWLATILATIGLVAMHIAVDVFNEASDMRTGIDLHTTRTPFSGGSGTLPAGAMSVRGAYIWGAIAAAIGAGIGIWFLFQVGWPLVPILILGALAVGAYSDFFGRIGIGEIVAGLGLGTLPILGASLVQDGHIGPAAIAASIPGFLMTFNLLLLNEFPDVQADRAGGRRHLIILFGRRAAARIYLLAVALVPVSIIVAVIIGALPRLTLIAAAPTLLTLPAWRWAPRAESERLPIPAQGANVAWNLLTNVLLAVALILAA